MPDRTTTNIASFLVTMARQQPDRPAVVAPARQRARCVSAQLTFKQLEDASNQLAAGFQNIGLRRGMRTALMVPPSLDFFALTFALFKLGAVPVLIDPGIGLSQLGKGLAEAEPEAFIGVLKAHAARLVFGWAKRTISLKITVGSYAWFGGFTLNQVRKRVPNGAPFLPVAPAPAEMAAILFTSGSTGPSKGVIYTHEYFCEQVEQIRRLYLIEPGEIDLPTFPSFALFGPALGMTAVLPQMDPTRPSKVNPVRIIETIREFGITDMFGSPAVINRVGRYGAEHGIRLPTLKRVISAGAPVPAKVMERFVTMLSPGVQVFTPYGATECLPVASIGSDEVLRETRRQTDSGKGVCVGRAVPGLTVKVIRITDDPIPAWNDQLELPRGEIGEIVVKGPHVTRAYFNRADSTALAKIHDPSDGGIYHRMGDVGYLDEQGRIWFCGRKSHRVVTPQGTFFTIPCEAIFNTHPAVYRTALVGVRGGEGIEPVLCVEREPSAAKVPDETLRSELRALATKYPHTQAIRTILFHPAFPVDIRHNAKIFREKLALWAARQTRRGVSQ